MEPELIQYIAEQVARAQLHMARKIMQQKERDERIAAIFGEVEEVGEEDATDS